LNILSALGRVAPSEAANSASSYYEGQHVHASIAAFAGLMAVAATVTLRSHQRRVTARPFQRFRTAMTAAKRNYAKAGSSREDAWKGRTDGFKKFGELGTAGVPPRPSRDDPPEQERYKGREKRKPRDTRRRDRLDDKTDWRDPRAEEQWNDPYQDKAPAKRPEQEKHFHRGGAWRLVNEERELQSMEDIPLARGKALVNSPAQGNNLDSGDSKDVSSGSRQDQVGGSSSSKNNAPLGAAKNDDAGILQTMSLLERARQAAEDGWDERRWEGLREDEWDEGRIEQAMVPRNMRERLKELTTPPAIKEYIETNLLGNRTRDRLPKGERRWVPFCGADPAHNGQRKAVDDGSGTALGKMANSVHNGFLRCRAECHPAGLRDEPGVYPPPERPEVAFIGASNVGKSSLLNTITRTMKLAEARDEMGVTRSISWYKCSKLPIDILDLPGYGAAKGSDFGNIIVDFVSTRKALRVVYILIDARSGLKPIDWQFLQTLGDEGPEKVFVLTKADLRVPWSLGKMCTATLQDIQCVPKASKRLIVVSARNGNGLHDLRQDLARRSMEWAAQANKSEAMRQKKEEAAALMSN